MYDVAKKLFNLYNDKSDTLFSKIIKNSSNCITQIGKYIADKQYSTKRGDMHAHTESELKEFAAMNKHQHLTTLHFISQRDVLKFSLEKWSGKTMSDTMTITDGDRLKAVGLLLKEELRDKVVFLLHIANKSNKAVLDSYNGG